MHDFSPANGENVDDPDPIFHLPGLFWLERIDDDDFQFAGDNGRAAVLKVRNILVFDRFQVMGPGNEATHLTFDTTYRVVPGKPTKIVPLTNDPMSPNNWAGTIWQATAKGSFSAAYDDGTFSVTGTMDSALAQEGTPGHYGHERNGVFVSAPEAGQFNHPSHQHLLALRR